MPLFGGAFDPPHYGHLRPLQEIVNICGFNSVHLLPTAKPVFKHKASNAEHRIAMTKLLCTHEKRFQVNLIEHSRKETSYTIKTLELLKQQHPNNALVFIMGMDSLKSIDKWRQWQKLFEYCHILVMCRPNDCIAQNQQDINYSQPSNLVATKTTYNFFTSQSKFEALIGSDMSAQTRAFISSKLAKPLNNEQGITYSQFTDILHTSSEGKLWLINNRSIGLSSSYVRSQIADEKDISNLVPNNILQYIVQHNLYR